MAYTPYYSGGWQSGEEGETPITPAALNHMESGISSATDTAESAAGYVKQGNISSGATITISFNAGAHILALSRHNNNSFGVLLVMDNSSSSYTVIGGELPSTVTVTKNNNTGSVTIKNNLNSAIGYLLI